jgi:hypothetical protein
MKQFSAASSLIVSGEDGRRLIVFLIIIGGGGGERFPTLIPFHFTFPFSPKRLDGTELFT